MKPLDVKTLLEELDAAEGKARTQGRVMLADELKACRAGIQKAAQDVDSSLGLSHDLLTRVENLEKNLGRKPFGQLNDAVAAASEQLAPANARLTELLTLAGSLLSQSKRDA